MRSFLEIVVRVSATLDETRLESTIGKLAEVLLPDELADAWSTGLGQPRAA